MDIKNFEISGRVVEAGTRRGIYNLKVEAWDKDSKYHDLLGIAFTNGHGDFTINFDSTYFREYAPDLAPDLFFKIYMGRQLMKNTVEEPIVNAKPKMAPIIEITMPTASDAGKDRLSAAQAYSTAAFFQQSDFKGVYQQFKGRVSTPVSAVSDMFINAFTNFNFKPVRPQGPSEDTIINQDIEYVREKLEAQKVTVGEVQPYNPKLNTTSLKSIRYFPLNLKAGQQVTLYEKDGKVRYYSVVQDTKPAHQTQAEDGEKAHLQSQLDNVQKELATTQKTVEQKDEQIVKLKKDIASIKRRQTQLDKLLKSEAFTRLLKAEQKKDDDKKDNA